MSARQKENERCPAPAEVLLACEGELPSAQSVRVLAHLRQCAACRARVQAEELIRTRLHDFLSHRFDADRDARSRHRRFDQRLQAPVHVRAAHRRQHWFSRQMMTAAAALLIVIGGLSLPAAHAESLGGILARVVAVVRDALGFEVTGGMTSQTRPIRAADRVPMSAATAITEPAPETQARLQAAATVSLAALPDRDTLDLAELDARLVLSDASLDLLREIHVSSTPRAVRVEGVIPAPRRKIVARLNALPYVSVALKSGPARESGGGRAAAAPGGLTRWVDYRLGDRPEKQVFVPELMRLTRTVSERVHTLREFAERYSDEVVKTMSPAARGKLQKLLDRHYQALTSELDTLDARLAILFGSSTRVFPSRRTPDDWQQRAYSGVVHAESLDRALRELLTLEDLPLVPPADDAVEEDHAVAAAFGALWNSVHAGRP